MKTITYFLSDNPVRPALNFVYNGQRCQLERDGLLLRFTGYWSMNYIEYMKETREITCLGKAKS